jgi:hypothetical protein
MIIECFNCDSKVDANIIAEHTTQDPDGFPYKVYLLECPVCKDPLLGGQGYDSIGFDKFEWGSVHRLWPPQEHQFIDATIPDLVSISLEEAHKCYRGKAYGACVEVISKMPAQAKIEA